MEESQKTERELLEEQLHLMKTTSNHIATIKGIVLLFACLIGISLALWLIVFAMSFEPIEI